MWIWEKLTGSGWKGFWKSALDTVSASSVGTPQKIPVWRRTSMIMNIWGSTELSPDLHLVAPFAESVSGCIEQSRTLVLFPSSSDSDPGSDLLIKIWAALAEKNTCVILIKPETKRASSTDSASEVLEHLSQAGNCVVWKGRSSMEPKSSFWKLLRFHLSAPQHLAKLLPEESTLVDHCQQV